MYSNSENHRDGIMEKAIVVLSGGQDSTTCLYWAKRSGYEPYALTFDYAQRHKIEIESARKIAEIADVDWECVALGPILKGTSPLVSSQSELEQYRDHASLPGGLEKTFVPMRNQLFLTIAVNRAVLHGTYSIITGVCQEDFGGYPDCRDVFIDAFERVTNKALYLDPNPRPRMIIQTPLMNLTKKESVDLAMDLEGCYAALAWSHTSYDGIYPPTGHDHATLLRAKGFEEANIPDPLILRAWTEAKMELPGTENYRNPQGGIGKYMRLAGLSC